MSNQEDINSLLKQAEIYQAHGLLAESKETYTKALKLIKGDERAVLNADRIFGTPHAPHCPDNF